MSRCDDVKGARQAPESFGKILVLTAGFEV